MDAGGSPVDNAVACSIRSNASSERGLRIRTILIDPDPRDGDDRSGQDVTARPGPDGRRRSGGRPINYLVTNTGNVTLTGVSR